MSSSGLIPSRCRESIVRAGAGAVITAAVLVVGGRAARADFIPVYGGPTYDAASGSGFKDPTVPPNQLGVNGGGMAHGMAKKFSANADLGLRAFRWDVSGAAAVELGNLGTDASGQTNVWAGAVNAGGVTVGSAQKYNGTVYEGPRAVRWEPGSTTAVVLGTLGTNASGFGEAYARAVNASGTVVGNAYKFNGSPSSLGSVAVRWEAGGTTPIELGHIGADSGGDTYVLASAVNAGGTIVGRAFKYSGNTFLGDRAVRWDAGTTVATELGHIGASPWGFTNAYATDLNDAGTAVGFADKHSGTTSPNWRAVRWDAGGTAATELADLGTDLSGHTLARASGVDERGAAYGSALKYGDAGFPLGSRAVRWEPGGTAAAELGHLGASTFGYTRAGAAAVNAHGTAVGFAEKYSGGTNLGMRAVGWPADGAAIDLNTLLDPASGWILTMAISISDTNFVAGVGLFDPDGSGPAAAYNRAFLLDASSVIPEPTSLVFVGSLALLAGRRRRR